MKAKITFCTSVVLLMLFMPFLPVRDEGEIYDSTLRLHVLANSDSTEDQTLKMKVRDAVLEKTDGLFSGMTEIDGVKELCAERIDEIRESAQNAVYENGYDYPVSVTLGEEYYPEREYGEMRLPSGRYTSLKVSIGEENGQNWWCVLFPPLCNGAAEAKEELVQTGFTPNQIRILTDTDTPKYVIRFRILEWAEDILELFR